MKILLIRASFYLLFFTLITTSFAQTPGRKGWWKFDDAANLTKSDIGSNLELVGTQLAIDGPSVGNGAVKIGIGSYFKMTHNIVPSPAAYVNEYTISIDFRIQSLGRWYSFFQTNIANSNDGDCFINTTGKIGVAATGYSSYSVKPNEWYRLVISVKNGTQYKYYLDGQLLLDGTIQALDGRFALDKTLLMFADEDREDSEIDCAEISIWDTPLNSSEINSLGGYGHQVGAPKTRQLLLVPYLQNPSPTSMFVSWHDTMATLTKVEYGTTSALGQSTLGTSEIVASDYRWHTVQLVGLEPNKEYFYKTVSGSGSSSVYNFRTSPGTNYNGKIRFLLLSDTHNSDTTMSSKIIREAKKKMRQLYGNDIHNQVNLVLHSGDLVVSGSTITQWTEQYFAPMSPLSTSIPFLTVIGNHEGEHQNYYKYMQYDDIAGYQAPNPFAEKFWSTVVANTMFIGLNSNLTGAAQTLQNMWLDQKLREAESNSQIDFVFLLSHHFPITELWGEGMSSTDGSGYIANQIIPMLKKYSKVAQLSYGHTHGFERGSIETESQSGRGDFRIVCGGGGGGAIDRWGSYRNQDFPNIQITLDHFFYQIIEIDVANKTFESTMYSLGNTSKSRDNEVMDKWYFKLNQVNPAKPTTNAPIINDTKIVFNTSAISGDSLMTVHIQVADAANFSKTAIDTSINWKDIYQVDANFSPIDRNKGIDLTRLSFDRSILKTGTTYYYRVKYRDHNLRWSEWSTVTSFNTPTSVAEGVIPITYSLEQNYPNPFNPSTAISYQISELSRVSLKIYDLLGKEVIELVNQKIEPGRYEAKFDGSSLTSGVYFYQLRATPLTGSNDGFTQTKKMILMK